MEMINLSSIFDSTIVKSSLVTNLVTTTAVFDIIGPIHSKIFNFNNFTSNLDVDQLLVDPTILPCNCDKSPFVDKDNGHILIVDSTIIKN